jgi:hypothetical protein
MSQHFCQGKVAKKVHKILSQNLCNLLLVFWVESGIIISVKGHESFGKTFLKKIKKPVDKLKKICYNNYTR